MRAQLSILAIACLLLPTNAVAQMAEQEVEQRVLSFYQTLNAGEAESWASHNAAQYHGGFPRNGLVFNPNLATAEFLQAGYDAGLVYQLAVRYLDVTVYGDAAVATFLTVGPQTNPDGTVIAGTFRATQVWVREGSSWKMAHFHISPLET